MVLMASFGLTFSPPNYNFSCNSLFQGTSIKLNFGLCVINSFLSYTLQLLVVLLLPINNDKIITVADDGINVTLGLQLTAYQMKTVTIISVILAIIILVLIYLLYFHNPDVNILPKFCVKYFSHAPLLNHLTNMDKRSWI